MKISIKNIVLLMSSMVIISCSEDKQVKKAPSSDSELGFIVMGPELGEIQAADVKYRVINKKHKLFEVYEPEEVVLKEFPTSTIEKNKFRKRFTQVTQEEIFKRENQTIDYFLAKCKKSKPLTISIDSSTKKSLRDKLSFKNVVELDETINLEAVQLDGNLNGTEFLWTLDRIGWAQYNQYVFSGKKLKYKPVGLGLNVVNVFARDKNNICGDAQVKLFVTSNAGLSKVAPEEQILLSPSILDHFNDAKIPNRSNNLNKVRVAVIDTGVNYNHYELYDSIFRNVGEIPDNNIDDDGNGFVDDFNGYDFYAQDAYPMDDSGHGSHVAGLIAGKSTGVTKNALIIPLKVGHSFGIDVASLAGAIFYAVDMKAKIINLSLGSKRRPTQIEIAALQYTIDNNILVVSAAGNGDSKTGLGVSLDRFPDYPASVKMPNKIVVAASSASSKPLTFYSNYGSVVDIVAPGGDVQSPLFSVAIENTLGINYNPMQGTSMAAPIVAGVAAELLSMNPNLTPEQVKQLIIESGDIDDQLKRFIPSQKHLNATNAYQMLTELSN